MPSAVGVRPLTGALNRDAAFLVKISQPGLRLEVGMFLVGCVVLALDDHIRPGKCGLHIAFADLVQHADVGIADFRVDARRFGFHCLSCIEDGGQVLVFHFDQIPCLGGDGLRFGDDGGYLVTLAADDVACRLLLSPGLLPTGRGVGPHKNRLVFLLQAVLIDRHVFGGIAPRHAGQGPGRGGVNADHTGVRTPGEQDLHVEHLRSDEIAGVQCRTGDFVMCVYAGDGLAD